MRIRSCSIIGLCLSSLIFSACGDDNGLEKDQPGQPVIVEGSVRISPQYNIMVGDTLRVAFTVSEHMAQDPLVQLSLTPAVDMSLSQKDGLAYVYTWRYDAGAANIPVGAPVTVRCSLTDLGGNTANVDLGSVVFQ